MGYHIGFPVWSITKPSPRPPQGEVDFPRKIFGETVHGTIGHPMRYLMGLPASSIASPVWDNVRRPTRKGEMVAVGNHTGTPTRYPISQ